MTIFRYLPDGAAQSPTRRTFLKSVGGAGALALTTPLPLTMAAQASATGQPPLAPSVYLEIAPDGTAILSIHRVEMGQGSRTGLAQILADELGADWDRLSFIPAYGDEKFGDQNTDGSTSIRNFYDTFRTAGATARTMLEQAAAARWNVPATAVTTQNHGVVRQDTGDRLDFADLVADAGGRAVPAPEALVFKTPEQRTYIGKPVPAIDLHDIVTGKAVFGQDVRRDKMLIAVVDRPPVVGGKVASYNRQAAMAIPGVIDVVDLPAPEKPYAFKPRGGVAVLAETTHAAKLGRVALATTFKGGDTPTFNTADYEQTLWQSLESDLKRDLSRGDTDTALAQSADTLEAGYFLPFLAHAPMEPPAATARWDGPDKLSIWTASQDPQAVQKAVAPLVGLDPADIYVECTLLGGAFGRKSKPDYACEAALLAQHAGRAVKVVWTREDDIRHDYYHAMSAQKITAGMDENGRVTAWRHRTSFPSIITTFAGDAVDRPQAFELGMGALDMPYAIPNIAVDTGKSTAPVRIGWLRSVINIHHVFAVACFTDELAQARGLDPLENLLELIGEDRLVNPADDGADYFNYNTGLDVHPINTARLKHVLRRVAEMAEYGRDLPQGQGIGLAVHRSFVSYVATAVEVAVTDGELTVKKVWTCIDCGLAINPDRVRAQMEGAVVFGLSIATTGEITAENGAIVEGNFDTYPVLRMDEAPDIAVEIVASEAAPGGVGEPGVPPVTPALLNAIYAATGKRIRRLPLKDQLRT